MSIVQDLSKAIGLSEVCSRYGIEQLEVFGSINRDGGDPESDIDLLYVLKPGVGLGWGIENLAIELTKVFGRRVDLVSRKALHPLLKETVLAEAKLLYEA